MATLKEAVEDFLAQRRIAVAGVSRETGAANLVYRKLKAAGYDVVAVNPNATSVEGDPCYPDLGAIPGGVDGVVIATRPDVAEQIVRECLRLGVPRVWMHRSFGEGSVSPDAVRLGREGGLTVIAGGCPMMFCQPVDFGHKCMRWVLSLTGGLPREA
ncbi:MAG: CoA-binding protein [Gemmatimonadales bacterium]|jgi:predicted CoA-binding protein